MDVSSLSVQELHAKLRAINLQSTKPFEKYPEEVIQLVSEAFARGMNIAQVQSLSEMPQPSLSYIHRRLRGAKKSEEDESRGFIKFKVEETEISQQTVARVDRVSVKIDASSFNRCHF